ncbi:MAG: hypothetical protein V2J55_04620 [Candidatus Competibacteraceae bacterium]|jgi:hypothetical protein|nr:hypothetical protein [Candidatus Competibacteraceae bacterium]
MNDPRHLVMQDTITKRIRFTRAGIEAYGREFAEAGYDIRRIHTWQEFDRATDAAFELQMRRVAQTTRGQSALLDRILAGLPGWED